MKCVDCGSYNTTMDGGPFLRRKQAEDGAVTFIPLTEQELASLSTVQIERAESDSSVDSEQSESDGGWETTEEEDVEHPGGADQMVEEDLD